MWLTSNFQKVKIVALTAFIYLISPIILLCIFLLLVYRTIISISAKVSRKDLVGMMCSSTSVYASDELYGIPNRNLVCALVLKGKLSIESLQSVFDKKILSLKNTKGQFKYPQLRMYPAKFQKFLFWKLEEEFKVDNHVIMYEKARDNNRVWTEHDLQEIQKNLIRKQWSRFSSPWEILLIPNYRSQTCGGGREKTVLCVRSHMCIENEVSWMKLLVKDLFDGNSCTLSSTIPGMFIPPTLTPLPSSEQCQNVENGYANQNMSTQGTFFRESEGIFSFVYGRILKKLIIPFRIPFDFAEQVLEPPSPNDWQVAETSLLKRDQVVVLDKFSVQHVKEIKNMLGVSFSSVLLAALSSALRVTFLETGLKLPSYMKVMLPISNNNSGDTIKGNDINGVGSLYWVNLPMGVSSSRERLRLCETLQKKLHKSTKPITNQFLQSLVGLLPFKYHWYFIRKRTWTGVLMNLKGPSEVLSFSDHQIEDVILSSASDSGFVLSFVSYADYLRISLVIDYRLFPSEAMAKNFLKNIYAELVLLGIDGAAAV